MKTINPFENAMSQLLKAAELLVHSSQFIDKTKKENLKQKIF